MSEGNSSVYMGELRKRDASLGELDRLAGYFDTVVSGLRARDLQLPNSDLNPGLTSRSPHSANWHHRPDKETVKQKLQEFYDGQSEAERLYRSLPEPERKYVQSPDLPQSGGGGQRRVTI